MSSIKNNNSSKVILTLVVALLVFFHFYHYKYLFISAIILGLTGVLSDYASEKIATVWMWFAKIIGKVIPKVILTLLYFLFFVPYALIYRLVRKNVLDLKVGGKETMYKERNHLYTPSDIENPW